MNKKEKLGQDPAFPLDAASEEKLDEGYGKGYPGISKRLYIATKAMQSLIINRKHDFVNDNCISLSKTSFKIADAMLEQEYE